MLEISTREKPQIDLLLDAFNSSKESISFMTVCYSEGGVFNVYFHGSPHEIALAIRSVPELDEVIQSAIRYETCSRHLRFSREVTL